MHDNITLVGVWLAWLNRCGFCEIKKGRWSSYKLATLLSPLEAWVYGVLGEAVGITTHLVRHSLADSGILELVSSALSRAWRSYCNRRNHNKWSHHDVGIRTSTVVKQDLGLEMIRATRQELLTC